MAPDLIDDILAFVEKPSRYLGTEINRVKKDPAAVKLRFALAFPDLYEIGTSHFGMQILYHILNCQADIAAERVFAPGVDLEARLKAGRRALFSLESHRPLNRFDIIGFSLLYELNYTNVLTILQLAGIPPLAAERDGSHPLIIAGGPCTCNPEPVADFFDAMVIGDGEETILQLCRAWMNWKANPPLEKTTLLKQWSQIEGVYIPAFFAPGFDAGGFQRLTPRVSGYTRIRRAVVGDLDQAPFATKPIVAFGKPVHDRLRLEISRGCTRGCRFCQAGMIYRPVRERAPENLLALTDQCVAATGYEDISLLSLSTGDYGCISALMQQLMARYRRQRVAISLPSLRVGTLTAELMAQIRQVRKTGFTIAPEAGTRRLRDVINKNISTTEIFKTVENAFSLGWQVIKLYFMVGLPTETTADLQALVEMVKKLRQIKVPGRRRGKINVSVATFIPKAHTPFQWAAQNGLAESREKIRWLQDRLQLPGIQFKWQNPEVSLLEGVWARGDRRLSRLLIDAHRRGCRFDGWSDRFRYSLWQEAFGQQGLDPDFFTMRPRDPAEPLPWDHIDSRVRKEFLLQEWQKAMQGGLTADCRHGDCCGCGVCDFEKIRPLTFEDCKSETAAAFPEKAATDTGGRFDKKVKISYSKLDAARYFGHLELVNIFLRAIKRAGIPVKYSQGFHPKPKVAFSDPLPVGIESQDESLILSLAADFQCPLLVKRLNRQLPDGLRVHDCRPVPAGHKSAPPAISTYRVVLNGAVFDVEELKRFLQRPALNITFVNRKGKLKKIDIRDMVIDMQLSDGARLQVRLKSEPGKTLRPVDILPHIFSLSVEQIRAGRVVKLKARP